MQTTMQPSLNSADARFYIRNNQLTTALIHLAGEAIQEAERNAEHSVQYQLNIDAAGVPLDPDGRSVQEATTMLKNIISHRLIKDGFSLSASTNSGFYIHWSNDSKEGTPSKDTYKRTIAYSLLKKQLLEIQGLIYDACLKNESSVQSEIAHMRVLPATIQENYIEEMLQGYRDASFTVDCVPRNHSTFVHISW